MLDRRVIIYSDDLISIIQGCKENMLAIKEKINSDELINRGLFLMATAYFEATLRDLMFIILTADPTKLQNDKFTVNKQLISYESTDSIRYSIIEDELYDLFKGNVKNQLIYSAYLLYNIIERNIKKPKNQELYELIQKCSDISIYRNCLIHNDGIKSKDFDEKICIYISSDFNLDYSKDRIMIFVNDYIDLLDVFNTKIMTNTTFLKKSRLNQIRTLWKECFKSPIMQFEDYWQIDEEKDLVVDIKYPDCEDSISSSEKVYLSIWRHQFYDGIPTEEFLLCSVNEDVISHMYKGLDKLKFYYMYQEAHML